VVISSHLPDNKIMVVQNMRQMLIGKQLGSLIVAGKLLPVNIDGGLLRLLCSSELLLKPDPRVFDGRPLVLFVLLALQHPVMSF